MKRGYAGDIVPLIPAMLAGAAVDQGEGLAQPTEPHHTPVDPSPPHPSPPHPSPPHQSPPHSPHPSPLHHSPPHSSPQSPPHLSPPRSYEAHLPEGNTSGSVEDSMQLKELMVLDIDDDPLVSLVRESMKEKSIDFVTSIKASGEAQEEEISPIMLDAEEDIGGEQGCFSGC
ncbi:hypothetical protein Tco_0082113 [Tanacetum coccineum]